MFGTEAVLIITWKRHVWNQSRFLTNWHYACRWACNTIVHTRSSPQFREAARIDSWPVARKCKRHAIHFRIARFFCWFLHMSGTYGDFLDLGKFSRRWFFLNFRHVCFFWAPIFLQSFPSSFQHFLEWHVSPPPSNFSCAFLYRFPPFLDFLIFGTGGGVATKSHISYHR